MRLGQITDEAAGDRAGPLAVNPPVGGMHNRAAPPRAGDGDVGEAAFLLQTGKATFVHRPLAGEHAFLPADQKDVIELQPLGCVDRHDRQLFGAVVGLIVHHQTDVFEEIAKRFVFLHRAGQFGEVFEAA